MLITSIQGLVSEAEARALARLIELLRSRFGARLREVRLFGSTARGERHEESDIDVAVPVDDLAGWGDGESEATLKRLLR